MEPLSIGCHAVDRAEIVAGEWVLVIGAGPIGLSVIPFAMAAGGEVIVMDISAQATGILPASMGVRNDHRRGRNRYAASEKLRRDLPTCVIDATGNAQSMARCFDLARSGGGSFLSDCFREI